jgi:hypothetical protein
VDRRASAMRRMTSAEPRLGRESGAASSSNDALSRSLSLADPAVPAPVLVLVPVPAPDAAVAVPDAGGASAAFTTGCLALRPGRAGCAMASSFRRRASSCLCSSSRDVRDCSDTQQSSACHTRAHTTHRHTVVTHTSTGCQQQMISRRHTPPTLWTLGCPRLQS